MLLLVESKVRDTYFLSTYLLVVTLKIKANFTVEFQDVKARANSNNLTLLDTVGIP